MGVLALASIKGSPGVTITTLALDAAWPVNRRSVVAELDPAGGDIGAWRSLAPEPSVVTLAAALRREQVGVATNLLDHCHELPGGLRVLCGSPSPMETGSAVDVIAERLPTLVAGAGLDVICDCGRLNWSCAAAGRDPAAPSPASAVARIARRADGLLIVTRAQLADLSHLDACLPALRSLNESLGVILVGHLRWSRDEVASQLGVEVVGHLPHDAAGADAVGGRPARGSVRRLPLLRAARALAERITAVLPAPRPSLAGQPDGATELRGIAAGAEAIP